MAKKKISRKKLLKTSDEFLTFSARAIIFAREHSRLFGYLGMVVVGLLLIFLGINTYLKHVNKKGQEAYNVAYYTMVKNMGPDTKPDELKKSEELFQQVTDKYGISKAARLALPELAYINFIQKNYDKAIFQYQQFLDKVADNDPYQSLARMALAVCYEEKGELDKAIRILKELTSGPDDFFNEQAMLSLARVYRLAHRQGESEEILKEFVDRFKTSPFLPVAKAYLNP
ncbi:MAG: tetratricopeptide repeat protein [Deltaproteobacteria bacterium]|nr:tetratricopeptide repeat protein [Deltaproteobacteria bacterium]